MRSRNVPGRQSVQISSAVKLRDTDLASGMDLREFNTPAILPLGQVRANLRRVFEGKRVVLVGTTWHPRAILIPLGPTGWLSKKERAARAKRLKPQIKLALELIDN